MDAYNVEGLIVVTAGNRLTLLSWSLQSNGEKQL